MPNLVDIDIVINVLERFIFIFEIKELFAF